MTSEAAIIDWFVKKWAKEISSCKGLTDKQLALLQRALDAARKKSAKEK